MHPQLHERIYRGEDALATFADAAITVCGAGAVGSMIVDQLSRQGFQRIRVIDFDRIESHNVGTQLYGLSDVGARKVNALRSIVYRATGVQIDARDKRVNSRTAKSLLRASDLVIDAFDNAKSRSIVQTHCINNSMACLHVGLSADYCEVIWSDRYVVPEDVGDDVCEYPLARNLVLFSVALASEIIIDYFTDGTTKSAAMTLRDQRVEPLN